MWGHVFTVMLVACVATVPAHANVPYKQCFEEAAKRYGVDKRMLVAIAKTESGIRAGVIGPKNANNTYDIGVMQINSAWRPTLAKYGISEQGLLDPCTNIHVGAWILANNIQAHGSTWKAVGAYNARTPSKQVAYVKKVQRNYELVSMLVN